MSDRSMLTPGERAVWAAEFVRRSADGRGHPEAACWAARAVEAMRRVVDSTKIDPPARRMLDDMLSNVGGGQ